MANAILNFHFDFPGTSLISFLFIPSVIFEDWLSLQKMKITLCLISSQVRRLEELVGLLVDDLPKVEFSSDGVF